MLPLKGITYIVLCYYLLVTYPNGEIDIFFYNKVCDVVILHLRYNIRYVGDNNLKIICIFIKHTCYLRSCMDLKYNS